tara:strand:- start:44 stop:934 length:891 start_codon:yes stop_codon:yes gene_type:complete
MKIFDCFMYFDEEIVLDIRLNTLNPYVDHFVIVESKYNHKGDKRNLEFNINKYKKFEKKIIYLVSNDLPEGIETINESDTEDHKSNKYITNALLRENSQRNYIIKGLNDADKNDVILISDVDEIPNLDSVNFQKINKKIMLFKQNMFYYKLNLVLPEIIWTGTKACRKKDLISPQWLRNVKDRIYPVWRLDTLFSDKKYSSMKVIENGGWHFSNIKSPNAIHHKLKSYLHHREFDEEPLTVQQIDNIIKNKQAIYDLRVDKRVNKVGNGQFLEKFNIQKLPSYILNNKEKFSDWLD